MSQQIEGPICPACEDGDHEGAGLCHLVYTCRCACNEYSPELVREMDDERVKGAVA